MFSIDEKGTRMKKVIESIVVNRNYSIQNIK